MKAADAERTYWEKRLGTSVSLNSVGYFGLSDAYVAFLYKIRRRQFLRLAGAFARPGMRVLDVGSGGGFYVDLWRSLGIREIAATDITDASVNVLRTRYPNIDAGRADIGDEQLPFPEESFDAISCMDVVHHLVEDERYDRAIANCSRMLKPGGRMVFTENFLHGPAFRAPHSVSRPLDYIEGALARAGLQVEERRPMFVLMNNPVDSRNRFAHLYWKILSFVSENTLVGAITGTLLYPFEVVLTTVLREGPSTEIMVCRRVPHAKSETRNFRRNGVAEAATSS
jgi:ubiquinone/menaquinone biosynthesis C-methylase UbiE